MESRIILDTAGAEKLVGKGDMLYAPLGQGKPKRVQGCFITDDEVQEVVSFVKASSEAEYSDTVMAEIDKKAAESGKSGSGSSGSAAAETDSSDGDEMLPAAVDVILETGQASVSMLQRRLKLGYARAARIMDEMEERGIVGRSRARSPVSCSSRASSGRPSRTARPFPASRSRKKSRDPFFGKSINKMTARNNFSVQIAPADFLPGKQKPEEILYGFPRIFVTHGEQIQASCAL